ncbi:MAG: tRNA (N(6)-L-threonylcarbamoyladenosine(37)-C(2))-methylthiotransferase MtaB [Planctomycetaceae bacterium]|nr:tRNA (N(6)-L-threonylcarbamoyladenosine(37)-C(2))-methylthiotransferase MtaB [Planctomycetaceae bacterium]
MYFRLHTLGCKVNQYETQLLRTALLQCGCTEADAADFADIVVVNTCTVTAESDAKSRKALRKLAAENPGAKVVAMGCAVTHQPDAMQQIRGITEIVADKQTVPEFLRQLGIAAWPKGIDAFADRHRAFVKIQDGCQVGCAYCIIPKVRPTLHSRPIEDILPEIQSLAKNGYREIVLTGIHLGHYALGLTELLRRAVDLPEMFRLRLSSLEAVEVSDELIDLMLRYPDRICPHLHLPMQSGSDAVLRRMKRRWMSETYARRCEEIASRFDRLALTTDIIVGFPGETAEQFEETCRLVERLRFAKVHVFRFSPRRGTEAAMLPERISATEQKRRAKVLTVCAEKLRRDFAESLIGSVETVLLETATSGMCGRYIEVSVREPLESGSLVAVRIESLDETGTLTATQECRAGLGG